MLEEMQLSVFLMYLLHLDRILLVILMIKYKNFLKNKQIYQQNVMPFFS
jgi:hypothetical protein